MKTIIICLSVLITYVSSHSWVACTKYTKTIQGQDYTNSSCAGYPRDWANYVGTNDVFAADHGANYQPGTTGQWCQKTIGSPTNGYGSTYSSLYPMATYKQGETIRVVWPAKNHANYECKSNTPDAQMKLYVNSNVNASTDPTGSSVSSQWTLVIDWHAANGNKGGDGIPFQNCPSFCASTDKAVCYGDFMVPTNLTNGVHTFLWYWAFNSNTDIYTSCWEANIQSTSSETVIVGNDTLINHDPSSLTYFIEIPLCYNGATYDRNLIEWVATSYFGVSVSSINAQQGTNSFNTTLILQAAQSDVSNYTSIVNTTLCDQIQSAFVNGTCSLCDDTTVSIRLTSEAYQMNVLMINLVAFILFIMNMF